MTQTPKNDMQVVKGLKQLANAPTTLGVHTSNSRELESTPTPSGTDEELETFISIWIPINVKDQQYIKEAKIDARKEFMQLIKQRDKAIELSLLERLDIGGGYGIYLDGNVDIDDRINQLKAELEELKAQQKETHHD